MRIRDFLQNTPIFPSALFLYTHQEFYCLVLDKQDLGGHWSVLAYREPRGCFSVFFFFFFFPGQQYYFALLKSFEKFKSNVLVCVNSCSGPLWGFVVAFMLFNVKGIATAKWGHKQLFYAFFGLILKILNCGQMIILLVLLYIYIYILFFPC